MAGIQAELNRAEAARSSGNEGMARVCARRAAGIAVGEYLARQEIRSDGQRSTGQSAYEKIRFFCTLPDIPPRTREIAGHFLLRITPDHTLPAEVDLIAEVRWLIQDLLGEEF